MTDEQVQSEVMGVLRLMFPNITVPDPLDFAFPRWHSDPLFRGSFSNWPSSFYAQHQDNLRARVNNLWFAGEATSFKYFVSSSRYIRYTEFGSLNRVQGFLHGAYYEGLSAGTSLANCVTKGDCVYTTDFDEVKICRSQDLQIPTGPF
jgi:polyamine oxidase